MNAVLLEAQAAIPYTMYWEAKSELELTREKMSDLQNQRQELICQIQILKQNALNYQEKLRLKEFCAQEVIAMNAREDRIYQLELELERALRYQSDADDDLKAVNLQNQQL